MKNNKKNESFYEISEAKNNRCEFDHYFSTDNRSYSIPFEE